MSPKLTLNSVVDILVLEFFVYTNMILLYFLWTTNILSLSFPFPAYILTAIIALSFLRLLSTRFLQKTPEVRTYFARIMYCFRVVIRIEPVGTVWRNNSEEIKEIRLIHACLEALPSSLLVAVIIFMLNQSPGRLFEVIASPTGVLMVMLLVSSVALVAWTASAVQDRSYALRRIGEACYVVCDMFGRITSIAITSVVLTAKEYDQIYIFLIIGIMLIYIMLIRFIWLRCNISGIHRVTSERINCTRAPALSIFLFCCIDLGRGHFMNILSLMEAAFMLFAAEYLTISNGSRIFSFDGYLFVVIAIAGAHVIKWILEYSLGPFSIADGKQLDHQKKQCPSCTYMNPYGRKNCEMCGEEVPGNVDYGDVDADIPVEYVYEKNNNIDVKGEYRRLQKSHEQMEMDLPEMKHSDEHPAPRRGQKHVQPRSKHYSYTHSRSSEGMKTNDLSDTKDSDASSGTVFSYDGQLGEQPQIWSCQEVGIYLHSLGPAYHRYIDVFSENMIEGDTLLRLDEADLSHLIDVPLHRKILIKKIKQLRRKERQAQHHRSRRVRHSRQRSEPTPKSAPQKYEDLDHRPQIQNEVSEETLAARRRFAKYQTR